MTEISEIADSIDQKVERLMTLTFNLMCSADFAPFEVVLRKELAAIAQSVQPAGRVPLTDAQLLKILIVIDSSTKRLPPGFKQFARAIEAAHGIRETK